MAITQAEAASALRDVEAATDRTVTMRAYSFASPHLVLWGLVWIAGYGLMGALPLEQWGMAWALLNGVGAGGSALLGYRSRVAARHAGLRAPGVCAMLVAIFFVCLFIVAVYVVFAPTRPEPYLVFPALVLGLVYVVAGVWKMRRMAVIGAAVFILALAGYALLQPWLAYWLAAVGGGGLVLGGLWLRKA
jgi:hypothetical protein